MALGKSILSVLSSKRTLLKEAERRKWRNLSVLEINEAGDLSPVLSKFKQHRLVSFPEIDMQNINFNNCSFDLVVHGDTLEHIPSPSDALSECYRILKHGGHMAFTVPVIVGRPTCSRASLTPSYHGNPLEKPEDYLVHSEFGTDVCELVLEAGFNAVQIFAIEYPTALAFVAYKQ